MSPRGVAIPDVQRQLFDAAERVLQREGPDGLNSRAITTEAGTAKGLLYRHFADLDAFLAAFVLDRAARLADRVSALPQRAGIGNVADNLTDAALSVAPQASALIDLIRGRWSLGAHLGRTRQPHAGALLALERAFAAYLDAERTTGRIAAQADTDALATALVGAVHQLAITPRSRADLERQTRRVVAALVGGILLGDQGDQPPVT
jgi:AcrR family transcriptional regulator